MGVTLDLPVPPSVNRARKIDWGAQRSVAQWKAAADWVLLAARYRPVTALRFEVHITFSEAHTKIDLDNAIKLLLDYLRRIEAIKDDSPKHLRKLTVEWGEAPEGCRVTVVPISG